MRYEVQQIQFKGIRHVIWDRETNTIVHSYKSPAFAARKARELNEKASA